IEEAEFIEVVGARENNLQNIEVRIPREKLVVITGLSGSGKSSLAFDTIYAEGQRRYLETFSAYARQFLGGLERPDVDKISGLSPVISIEQKTISRNPRSTVGTITEIYDFLRLMYARAGEAYSYVTGEKMVRYSDEQIARRICDDYSGQKLMILASLVKGRKGHYRELFDHIMKSGYVKARVDGELIDLEPGFRVDRYKIHDIEVVIDRLEASSDAYQRVLQSVQTALRMGKGSMLIAFTDSKDVRHFSKFLMCPTSGISYSEPEPNLFSFNSPYGACPSCNGLGEVAEVDIDKVIPDPSKSLKQGAILPLQEINYSYSLAQVEALLELYGYNSKTPLKDVSDAFLNELINGSEEEVTIMIGNGAGRPFTEPFAGLVTLVEHAANSSDSLALKRWAAGFMNRKDCLTCNGTRLKKESSYFKINNEDISSLASMDISQLSAWFSNIEAALSERQQVILREPLKEVRARLQFLLDVGLDYLTLNRSARTISGGEAQRIRLATQIGSKLVGVLYILDEPSIGLHQRDNHKLIESLKQLRDAGNTVIVVEHDKDMMLESDYLIDIGPGAGLHGGRVVAQGSPKDYLSGDSVTAKYLSGELRIEVPKKRRKGNGKKLVLKGATGHNLKDVNLTLPLGTFICVTGVSGSGKSSLINQTLYPILHNHFYEETKQALPYKKISGLEHLDKVIEIDQSPIGRTPRSNPATYTGIFSEIRNLFTRLPEAAIRGYKPGRFSFNVSGGRCETCKGAGVRVIEMNFLPDVYVDCETCNGKRYNRETLEVRYRGKSISDVLDMTIEDAVEFFTNIPKIRRMAQTLRDVGLGYITLGQQSTTLSGGEAQRVKLAAELARIGTGNTIYILDEPTTGLHFQDVQMLIDVLNRLVDQGNTVLVIEHNLDVIQVADHLVDIGPEGGQGGGTIVAQGTPEQVAKSGLGYTGKFLEV
ncbi:MAG: excinuclease subunit, partial [Bacteroidota bacterium]